MTRKTFQQRIADAAEWRLLAVLLERPCGGWHAEVGAVAAEIRDSALRAAATGAAGATEGEYLRVFGPGGTVSPREVTYQPFADPGHLLADLATVYDAFAFRPRVDEPLDHVAVETAFVGYVLLKEAYAAARGARALAGRAAHTRAAFVDAHLAAFAAAVAQRLETCADSYLLPTARVLAARVPARAPVVPPPIIDGPDTCGACV